MNALHRLLYAVAALFAVVGACIVAWSVQAFAAEPPSGTQLLLIIVLAAATVTCGRFPLRMGLSDSLVLIDSIPLVLATMLLPTEEVVLLVTLTTALSLIGQPRIPGVVGWFWRVQAPLATAIAVAVASWVAGAIGARGLDAMPVLLIEAFVVAAVLELMFDALLFVELECEGRGLGVSFFRAWAPLAANVFLPTAAAAILTPYVAERPWQFALLLPVLLLGMYGALWVANSQQREKRRGDRLRDTFSRYVPEGIVDDNIETMQQVELGGEQRDVSVLFCDIRGFTTWSEDKGATEVITELNVLLSELSASVMSTGGTLDKFTGDGLMAFWGAPVPMQDHADRACHAALDMLQRLDEVNGRRQEQGHEPFAIGVAVHSGTAVVGNVGHERRLDYTAIGDTVNTTARLEASTKDIGAVLLVSRETVDELGGELRERAMLIGDVVMKGKARPVEAWALQPLRPELDGVDDTFAA